MPRGLYRCSIVRSRGCLNLPQRARVRSTSDLVISGVFSRWCAPPWELRIAVRIAAVTILRGTFRDTEQPFCFCYQFLGAFPVLARLLLRPTGVFNSLPQFSNQIGIHA